MCFTYPYKAVGSSDLVLPFTSWAIGSGTGADVLLVRTTVVWAGGERSTSVGKVSLFLAVLTTDGVGCQSVYWNSVPTEGDAARNCLGT